MFNGMTFERFCELAPIRADRGDVPVLAFPWGCPPGALIAYRKGSTIEFGYERASVKVPPQFIVKRELQATNLWQEMNAVNDSVNKGDTMTATTPVHKYLLDNGSVKVWVYIDPAKTVYNDL